MWSCTYLWFSVSLVIYLLYLFDSFQFNILDLQLYGIFFSISLIQKRQKSSLSPHQFYFHIFQVLHLHFTWIINSNNINLFLVTPWYLSVGFVVIICFFLLILKTQIHSYVYMHVYTYTHVCICYFTVYGLFMLGLDFQ